MLRGHGLLDRYYRSGPLRLFRLPGDREGVAFMSFWSS